MPAKVLPTIEQFSEFEQQLVQRGFRRFSDVEFRSAFRRLALEAPRPRPSREAGFVFHANELTVYVWTTWLRPEGTIRDEDAGWVLICHKDKRQYVAHPMNRTKDFLLHLFRVAWIAHWRILHRPLCPECDHFMDITRGRAMKSRYWRCDRRLLHKDRKPRSADWDIGLPPKAKQLVTSLREQRAKYRAERTAAGKKNFVAIRNRKPWGSRAA